MASISHRAMRSGLFTLVCAATALLYAPRTGRWYTSDSFALHTLGARLWQGEGYTTQAVRDLYVEALPAAEAMPSRSFPPLLPTLAGGINRALNLGVGAGVLVGAASAAGMYAVAAVTPFSAAPYALQCLTLFIFMVLNAGFVGELLGGRTVPLATLLMMGVVHASLALRVQPTAARAAALGTLLAACVLNRFDAAPTAAALPLLVWLLPGATRIDRAKTLQALAVTYAMMIAAYLPWAARNWHVFNTPFASDNGVTALALANAEGLAYPRSAVEIFWDAPGIWVGQRLRFVWHNLVLLTAHPRGLCLWPLLLLPSLRPRAYSLQVRQHTLLALGILALNLATVSLTPYADLRYFSAATCVVWTALPALLPGALPVPQRRGWQAGLVAAAALAVVGVGAARFDGRPWGLAPCGEEPLRYAEAARTFAPWLDHDDVGRVASRYPETLAHYTGWRTVALPYRTPATTSDYDAWLRDWGPRYAVVEGARDGEAEALPHGHLLARTSQGLSLIRFEP